MIKKTLTVVFILIGFNSFGQVDAAIDAKIETKINSSIAQTISDFSKKLDSVVIKNRTQSGVFYIDTLSAPINDVALYQVSVIGISGANRPSAVKVVLVTNNNGVYSISRNVSLLAFSGLTGGNFDVVLLNGLPQIKVTGTTSSIKWTYKKINL